MIHDICSAFHNSTTYQKTCQFINTDCPIPVTTNTAPKSIEIHAIALVTEMSYRMFNKNFN
jgi:hypothetical protein